MCLPAPSVYYYYCPCPLEMRPFMHAESYNTNRIIPRKRKYYWKQTPWRISHTALSSLMLSGLLSARLPSLPLGGCSSLLPSRWPGKPKARECFSLVSKELYFPAPSSGKCLVWYTKISHSNAKNRKYFLAGVAISGNKWQVTSKWPQVVS